MIFGRHIPQLYVPWQFNTDSSASSSSLEHGLIGHSFNEHVPLPSKIVGSLISVPGRQFSEGKKKSFVLEMLKYAAL
jgi:hypothetical protein